MEMIYVKASLEHVRRSVANIEGWKMNKWMNGWADVSRKPK